MSRKIRVLLVDDDDLLRKLVTSQLARSGFDTSAAASGQEALDFLLETDCDVVLLDIQMPGLSGLEALRTIRQMEDAPEVVMLTADTSLATGIEAMRLGAYDYLTKPASLDEMEAVIRKAYEKRRLIRQNAGLRAAVREPAFTDEESGPIPVYKSAAMSSVVAQAETVARVDSALLITGESGTGKDVLVRYIHARSSRRETPIIRVNCGALPDALFESEFFGHERGAFTGASSLKRGLIEAADGATLFLDEVGETPLAMQVKLLHFLEEGRFRRVGSTRDQSADVRVIAATNRNLQQDVQEGKFRADLFYRLNVVSLHVPPLRERAEDIPALLEHFLALYRQRFNRPALDLSAQARRQLAAYNWPGNVRELRNCLERAAALATADMIEAEQVLPREDAKRAAAGGVAASELPSSQPTAPATLEELERQHILRVLDETHGNRERAAAVLGISARTLYRKLREYERDAGAMGSAGE